MGCPFFIFCCNDWPHPFIVYFMPKSCVWVTHAPSMFPKDSGLEYLKMAYNSYYVMFYDYYSISSRGFIRKWIYNNFYAILNLQNRKSNHKRREFRCISLAWWGPTKFGLGDGPYCCFECLEFGRLLHRKVRFLS